MHLPDAGRAASARLRRVGWFLHAQLVETKLHALAYAAKANFDPNQPRVPAGNTDGGQWTDGGGGSSSGGQSERIRLAQNDPPDRESMFRISHGHAGAFKVFQISRRRNLPHHVCRMRWLIRSPRSREHHSCARGTPRPDQCRTPSCGQPRDDCSGGRFVGLGVAASDRKLFRSATNFGGTSGCCFATTPRLRNPSHCGEGCRRERRVS